MSLDEGPEGSSRTFFPTCQVRVVWFYVSCRPRPPPPPLPPDLNLQLRMAVLPAGRGSTQLDLDHGQSSGKSADPFLLPCMGDLNDTSQGVFSQPHDKIPTRTLGLLLACWCFWWCWCCCCWLAAAAAVVVAAVAACCLPLAFACCFAAFGLLVLRLLACWIAAAFAGAGCLLLAGACCFAGAVAADLLLLLACWFAADLALLVACLASGLLPLLVLVYGAATTKGSPTPVSQVALHAWNAK